MKKRFLSIILVVLILISTLPTNVFAEEEIPFILEVPQSAEIGKEIVVKGTVKEEISVAGFGFELHYDEEVLEWVTGYFSKGFLQIEPGFETPGIVYLSDSTPNGDNINANEFFELTFRIKDTAKAFTETSVDGYMFYIEDDGITAPEYNLKFDPATIRIENNQTITKEIEEVHISRIPSKTSYTVGESFDPSGLVVTVKYNDGSIEGIRSGFDISEVDTSTEGIKAVTVTYGGKSAAFNIDIHTFGPVTFGLDAPETVYIGQTFTVTGHTDTELSVSGFDLRLFYDKDVFEYVSSECLWAGTNIDINDINDEEQGTFYISGAAGSGNINTKELFNVVFTVKDTAGESTEASMDGMLSYTREQTGDSFEYEVTFDPVTIQITEEIPHEHTWSEWNTEQAATCTEGGIESRTCEICGEQQTRSTAPDTENGHDYVEDITDPTCTETGYSTHVCSYCGDSYTDSETEALGHTEKISTGADATCTEDGLTDGKYCSVCGEIIAEQETIPATGHTTLLVEAKTPTYSEDGNIEYYECHCGAYFIDSEGMVEITDKTSVLIPKLIIVAAGKAEVSKDAVEDALQKAEESEVIRLPITESENEEEVTSTSIDSESLNVIASAQKPLEIETSSYTVTLDPQAIAAVQDIVKGAAPIVMKVEEIKEEVLTEKQQEVVQKKEVAAIVSMEIICNEEKVTSFNGGTMTVRIPFEPKEGTNGDDYIVLYIADDGHIEEIKTSYKNGCIVMELEHLSDYIIVNKLAEILPGDINKDGKINAVDATQILRYANNKTSVFTNMADDEKSERADVNNDGKINALDATQILRYANNKSSVLKK